MGDLSKRITNGKRGRDMKTKAEIIEILKEEFGGLISVVTINYVTDRLTEQPEGVSGLGQVEYFPHTEPIFKADELLPCPFCGGVGELTFKGNSHTNSRSATIKCKKCRVQITNAALKHDSKWCAEATIEDWNNRHFHPQPISEERIEELANGHIESIKGVMFKWHAKQDFTKGLKAALKELNKQ